MGRIVRLVSSLSAGFLVLVLSRAILNGLCLFVVFDNVNSFKAFREWMSDCDCLFPVQSSNQMSQFGLDEARPDRLRFFRLAGGGDTQVIFVVVREETVSLEKVVPGKLLHKDLINDVATTLQLAQDHSLSGQ